METHVELLRYGLEQHPSKSYRKRDGSEKKAKSSGDKEVIIKNLYYRTSTYTSGHIYDVHFHNTGPILTEKSTQTCAVSQLHTMRSLYIVYIFY